MGNLRHSFYSILALLIVSITAYFIFRGVTGLQNTNIQMSNGTLKSVSEKAMEGAKGNYAIVIKNLKTGESYYKNEHQVFEAGSLYKLWIMTTALKQIQDSMLKEDQVLSEDISILNEQFNIASDLAEQTEGTITLTVSDALNQMITISHNYAALLLTQKIKLSQVATFLRENGFAESDVGTNGESPTTTSSDIGLFYEKLYKGMLADEKNTGKMIKLLKNQQLNDGLPKYLPDDLAIAHKTGDIDFFKHDGGIVYTSSGDYMLVVMSESDFPAGAQERIALLSKAVFDYFTGNPNPTRGVD